MSRGGRTGDAVTVVGDAVLDVDWSGDVERISPDAPVPVLDTHDEVRRPGGAALAARSAAEAGAAVTLVTALGDDAEGAWLRAGLEAAGVHVVDLGLAGPTPVKLRVRADGQSLVRVDRNCTPVAAVGRWTDTATDVIDAAATVLVSDYGRGLAATPALSARLQQMRGHVPIVWDPHPRGPQPLSGIDLLTPNLAEAAHLLGRAVARLDSRAPAVAAAEVAGQLAVRFDAAVAVTAGSLGAVLAEPGRPPVALPADPVQGDPCGAGDRFAATVAVARARRTSLVAAVGRAVAAAGDHVAAAAGDHVAGGFPPPNPAGDACRVRAVTPGGAARNSADAAVVAGVSTRQDGNDVVDRVARLRSAGHTVVATGGCFDVLHTGHVRLLEAARRLGDHLVVCLNGDLSVRRLKGRHRPVNRAADRAEVLRGLGCVDDVIVFEEDTPCDVLRRLRPALFVKGADYAGRALPEDEVLAEWGGRVVLVPLVPGRSTTTILRAAAAAG